MNGIKADGRGYKGKRGKPGLYSAPVFPARLEVITAPKTSGKDQNLS